MLLTYLPGWIMANDNSCKRLEKKREVSKFNSKCPFLSDEGGCEISQAY